MSESSLQVEALIERGLTLYENGEIDNAVSAWEQALHLQPSNSRANGYVDYVRLHYDVLAGASVDEAATALDDPFGVSTSPQSDYRIAIAPFGASPAKVGHTQPDEGIDEGWFLDADGLGRSAQSNGVVRDRSVNPRLQFEAPDLADDLLIAHAASSVSTHQLAATDSLAVLDELDFGITAQRSLVLVPPAAASVAGESVAGESVAGESEVLEYEADEPASDSYSAQYADDLDASFGIAPQQVPGHGSSVDDDDRDFEMTLRSEVPQPMEGLVDFESEGTGVLQRENGFVAAQSRKRSNAPQFKMSLRTPTSLDEIDLDDVDEAGSGAGAVPAAVPIVERPEIAARTPSRPTSQFSGLGHGPIPTHAEPAAPAPALLLPTAPVVAAMVLPVIATGRGKTRGDLFPVNPSALIPPAAARTEELSQRAMFAVSQAEDNDSELPELVIELLEPTADDAGYDPDSHDDEFTGARPIDQTVNLTRGATEYEPVLPFDPIAAGAAGLLHELDATAPDNEGRDAFVRRRITGLLALAGEARRDGDLERAVAAIELALTQDPESALGQKLVQRHREEIVTSLQQYLGDMNHNPRLAKPMNELGGMQIGPRAAFLVSRIDGGITYDELLDVSGMPRMEALRYLCQMVMRGVVA